MRAYIAGFRPYISRVGERRRFRPMESKELSSSSVFADSGTVGIWIQMSGDLTRGLGIGMDWTKLENTALR